MRVRLLAAGLVLVPSLLACSEDPAPVATTPPVVVATSSPPSLTPVEGCSVITPPPPLPTQFAGRPPQTVEDGEAYYATMDTNCGEIVWRMRVNPAPLTVNSFVALAKAHYFDGGYCSRLTNSPAFAVLQCGDTGGGGPGYTLPEENLPSSAPGQPAYPRGTVAMARTPTPGSGHSVFFVVIRDSSLPPDYTVFGTVVKGLDVLDKIASFGIEGGASDGPPARRIFIEEFTVSKTAP